MLFFCSNKYVTSDIVPIGVIFLSVLCAIELCHLSCSCCVGMAVICFIYCINDFLT